MFRILIPTYNRSAKLERTLRCYQSLFQKKNLEVIILDGSSSDHASLNKKTVLNYNFAKYEHHPNSSFHRRVSGCLANLEDDLIVCLGTDEDVFLPEYIEKAYGFLSGNMLYSSYLGRYCTFLKPFLGLSRISHYRDTIIDVDINQDSAIQRVGLLSACISLGCSPVYWGVRSVKNLKESLKIQSEVEFLSSREIVDQIVLAWQGKIKFENMPMLLRDETRIDYIVEDNRQDSFNYFPSGERNKIIGVLSSYFGNAIEDPARVFTDRYMVSFVPSGQPSIMTKNHLKSYTKYEPLDPTRNFIRSFDFHLKRIVYISLELITAQIGILDLKKRYTKEAINIFLAKVKSNQLNSR